MKAVASSLRLACAWVAVLSCVSLCLGKPFGKLSFESVPEGSSLRVEDRAGGPTTEFSDKAWS